MWKSHNSQKSLYVRSSRIFVHVRKIMESLKNFFFLCFQTNQVFNIHLMDVFYLKNNSVLARGGILAAERFLNLGKISAGFWRPRFLNHGRILAAEISESRRPKSCRESRRDLGEISVKILHGNPVGMLGEHSQSL